MKSIAEAEATWPRGSELDQILDKFSGDIVQAVQALKESKPDPSTELMASLEDLLASFDSCADYCSDAGSAPDSPKRYPFTRAERQVRDVVKFLYPAMSISSRSSRAPIEVDIAKRHPGIETFKVGPYQMPRLFSGLWQLSSPAWGSGSVESQEAALAHLVESGLTAADMADHYVCKTQHHLPRMNCTNRHPLQGDAELIYGDFRSRLPAEVQETVYAATKWCIFGQLDRPVTTEFVLEGVRERSRRLGGRVELLQFHWHDVS